MKILKRKNTPITHHIDWKSKTTRWWSVSRLLSSMTWSPDMKNIMTSRLRSHSQRIMIWTLMVISTSQDFSGVLLKTRLHMMQSTRKVPSTQSSNLLNGTPWSHWYMLEVWQLTKNGCLRKVWIKHLTLIHASCYWFQKTNLTSTLLMQVLILESTKSGTSLWTRMWSMALTPRLGLLKSCPCT